MKNFEEEHTAEIFKLKPSDSFVNFINQLLTKFKRKRNQDKLLKEFYGGTNSNWKEYFHPCKEKKVVFLMLIHLPERLIGFLEQDDKVAPEVIKKHSCHLLARPSRLDADQN